MSAVGSLLYAVMATRQTSPMRFKYWGVICRHLEGGTARRAVSPGNARQGDHIWVRQTFGWVFIAIEMQTGVGTVTRGGLPPATFTRLLVGR